MNHSASYEENQNHSAGYQQYYTGFPAPNQAYASTPAFKFLAQRPSNSHYHEPSYQHPVDSLTRCATNDFYSPYNSAYTAYSYPNDSFQYRYQSPVQYASFQPTTARPHLPWANGPGSTAQYVNSSLESSGYQSQLVSPNTSLAKQINFDIIASPVNEAKTSKRSAENQADKENAGLDEQKAKKARRIEKLEINVCYENKRPSQRVDSTYERHLFPCQLCAAVLDSAAKLLMHIHKYHEHGISSQCPVCHKKFGNPANTLVHLRVHTQEKTYKCEMCPSAFCDSSTLKKHMRIHTGERPYVCRICSKKFTQSGNLKRHLLVHEKQDASQQSTVPSAVEQPPELQTGQYDYFQHQPNLNFAQFPADQAYFQYPNFSDC